MKIVHCILAFNTGGAETMLADLLNEQVKRHDVTLVVVNDSFEESLLGRVDPRVRRCLVRRRPGSRSPWPLLRLNRLLRRLHPEVLHLHNSTIFRMLLPGCFSCSGDLFLTVHAQGVDLRPCGRARCLLAISRVVADDIRRRSGLPVRIVPNGIVTERILRRPRVGIAEGRRMRVVNVARLEYADKGQDLLLQAMGLLRQRGEDLIETDFIGSGMDAAALQQMAEKYGVRDRVRFLGLRDRDYIYSHLRDYDLMCHPARREGFGLTVAEGMAAALPILTATGSGPAELIRQGRLGTLFENGQAGDCARALESLYRHYDDALLPVEEAADDVALHYSVRRMAEEYENAYRNN